VIGAAVEPPAIELVDIDKRFGPVRANDRVNLTVARGTVHGIVGENGAGKSTLMSILYGFYEADGGEIRVGGAPVRIRRPADAIRLGIGMVHQHFMLVDSLSVVENVVLGAEGARCSPGALPGRGWSLRALPPTTASPWTSMRASVTCPWGCSSVSKS